MAETKSPELEAIEKITGQVDEFKKQLGDRVGKEEFEKATKALEELKGGLNKWEEKKIDDSIKGINDSITKMGKHLEEMQEEVNRAKEKSNTSGGRLKLLDDDAVKNFVKELWPDGTSSRKSDRLPGLKMNANLRDARIAKAAENFGYPQFFEGAAGTVSDAFTGRFIDPMLYQRKRKRNLILDNFPIQSITVPKLIFLEKKEIAGDNGSSEDVGGADWIASGGEKPKRSFRVTTGEVEAKKAAIFGTVEDKLLRDVPSLENWIREDFMDEMAETYNDALLNNDPDGGGNADAPLGIKTNAIQYSATDAFNAVITDANEIDAIVAVVAYMSTLRERPDMVFVADDIFFKIMILKGNDGHYQNKGLVYVSNAGQMYIGGVQVVPADVEDIPSTHLMATAADLGFKIKNYGPMVFERGLNGEDFRNDRTSYRGYQEVLSYIPEHRYNSVLYDTFANVIAAIGAGS